MTEKQKIEQSIGLLPSIAASNIGSCGRRTVIQTATLEPFFRAGSMTGNYPVVDLATAGYRSQSPVIASYTFSDQDTDLSNCRFLTPEIDRKTQVYDALRSHRLNRGAWYDRGDGRGNLTGPLLCLSCRALAAASLDRNRPRHPL